MFEKSHTGTIRFSIASGDSVTKARLVPLTEQALRLEGARIRDLIAALYSERATSVDLCLFDPLESPPGQPVSE